jgi:hypothetical protein
MNCISVREEFYDLGAYSSNPMRTAMVPGSGISMREGFYHLGT